MLGIQLVSVGKRGGWGVGAGGGEIFLVPFETIFKHGNGFLDSAMSA